MGVDRERLPLFSDAAEMKHRYGNTDLGGIGSPQRTRDHAGLQQFHTVEKTNELIRVAGHDRRCAVVIPQPHGLGHGITVNLRSGMRYHEITTRRQRRYQSVNYLVRLLGSSASVIKLRIPSSIRPTGWVKPNVRAASRKMTSGSRMST